MSKLQMALAIVGGIAIGYVLAEHGRASADSSLQTGEYVIQAANDSVAWVLNSHNGNIYHCYSINSDHDKCKKLNGIQ